MSTDPIEYLNTLSDEQREAALTTEDPVTIIACAGSGKTRTLIGRLIHLILPREMGGLGADPNSVMMVTFTNKSAREMQERIAPVISKLREMNPAIQGEPWIGTFHGLSLRILRVEARRAGLGENFSIFDESDAAGLAKEIAENLDLESFDVDEFFRDMEGAKARMMSPELLSRKAFDIEIAKRTGAPLTGPLKAWKNTIDGFHTENFIQVYSEYQSTLAEQNAVDFSDLLNRVTKLFQENEDVRNSWRSTFRHFMVDEVQDTNRAQVAWLDALTDGGREMVVSRQDYSNSLASAEDGNHEINGYRVRQFPRPTVAFVGDDDQSIYAFRGSDPSILRLLNDRYPGMKLRFMRESYRCQPAILDVANTLVTNNSGRYDKTIRAADQTRKRQTVYVEEHRTPADEIECLCDEAEAHIADGEDPSQFAVLTRTRDLAKAVARRMRERGLPVIEGKASDIRKTAEVRDAMAFAGFITNPDAEVYLRRIINKPARGLGPTSMGRVNANARKKGITFLEEISSIANDRIEIPEDGEGYKAAFVRNLKAFGLLIGQMRKDVSHAKNAGDAILQILERSNYLPNMRRDAMRAAGINDADLEGLPPREFLTALIGRVSGSRASNEEERISREVEKQAELSGISSEDLADKAGHLSEASRRIGNIALLIEQAEHCETLDAFMQEATLEMSQAEQAAGIQVMTVHASKGLEFSKVRLPFWMENIFPHSRAVEEGGAAIEEERRLAYVALTRAIDDVRISRSWQTFGCPFIRLKSSYPSRFIDEMGKSPNKSFGRRTAGRRAGAYATKAKPKSKPAYKEASRSLADLLSKRKPAAEVRTEPAVASGAATTIPAARKLPEAQTRTVSDEPVVGDLFPTGNTSTPVDDRPFAPISEQDYLEMMDRAPDIEPEDIVPVYEPEADDDDECQPSLF